MPASRRESKTIRYHRRDLSNDGAANVNDCTTVTTTHGMFTDEQLKLRAMIPAITVSAQIYYSDNFLIFWSFLFSLPMVQNRQPQRSGPRSSLK